MTAATIDARALPRELRRGLGKIDRRLRGVAMTRGLGLAAIALAAIAALGMAADFAWAIPQAARWAIWGAWIAAGGITLIATAIVPQVRRPDYADLAAVAERDRPDLGERLTSAVELIGARTTPHGSAAMIAALGEQAAEHAAGADLSGSVKRGRASAILAAGVVLAGLVASPSFVRPEPFRTLAHRFLMPWADVERIGRFVVEVAPGDAVVAVGSDVEVVGTARPRLGDFGIPGSAVLEWAGADRAIHRAAMTADEARANSSRTFRLTVPRLAESIRYRVVVDSEASRRHEITALEPPAVATVAAKVEPPSYTRLPIAPAKNPSRIEAWEGSRVTIAMTANQPLKSARLEWPAIGERQSSGRAATSIVPLESRDGLTWTATVPAVASGNYGFAMEESHGLRNRPEPPRRLVVKPDMPPTVALGGSGNDREAQADDLLVVDVLARDDLGLSTAEMLYAIDRAKGSSGPEGGEKAAALDGLGTTRARGESSLGLKSLSLKAGDIVTYRIRVTDTRPEPKGPNVTVSAPRTLRIVDHAEPLLSRERSIERQTLQDQLTAIKKLAAENRQGAEALRYAADAAQRGNGKWDRAKQAELATREGSARSVIDKLQALARDFSESGQFASLGRPARQIADVEAEAGRETLDSARQSADASKRLTHLRAADDRLASVQVRLDELQRRFDELAKLDDDRRKLRELAEKQDELAKKAEEMADSDDRAALEKLQQEQDQLRAQADELARRSPELKAEALAARAKEADDLARRARELAERQREEARKTADPAGRDARLNDLAEAQRRIEDAARRLALQVDRPLEENGRGRLDAGALARPIEPIERGEIEAGSQRLNEAEDALRRLSRDLDDVRDDPKALARRLARRQDVLNNQVAEMVAQSRDPDQKAALAEGLKPFAAREDAIARLAAGLPVPDDLKNLAKEAVAAVERSRDDLNTNKNDQVQNHQNEARDRLSRLADALPDLNQRRQQMLQSLNEARGRTQSVANELENHLRETAPRPDQRDFDPEAAARELSRRVAPLADRQAEAVRHLAEIAPDAQVAPQHQRALDRARDLADALDALRESAPPESRPREARPPADWRILGAFDDARKMPPFAIDRPVDLKAAYNGRKGSHPTWRVVHPGQDGLIDLGAMYSQEQNQSAFGYAEVSSPARGKGRLLVGSDDNITIWLNGKRVLESNNPRSYAPAQDRVDVTFEQGANRLLVLCGNGSDQWKFSVAAQPPRPPDLAHRADRVQAIRDALPALKADATASLDRLDQKIQGREPADERAAELAEDLKALDDRPQAPDRPSRAEEMRRIATALRGLATPDARAHQAEAIRSADRAARATSADAPDAPRARARAAKAAESLARRLADAAGPAESADALARAQEGLNAADATRDPRAPRASRPSEPSPTTWRRHDDRVAPEGRRPPRRQGRIGDGRSVRPAPRRRPLARADERGPRRLRQGHRGPGPRRAQARLGRAERSGSGESARSGQGLGRATEGAGREGESPRTEGQSGPEGRRPRAGRDRRGTRRDRPRAGRDRRRHAIGGRPLALEFPAPTRGRGASRRVARRGGPGRGRDGRQPPGEGRREGPGRRRGAGTIGAKPPREGPRIGQSAPGPGRPRPGHRRGPGAAAGGARPRGPSVAASVCRPSWASAAPPKKSSATRPPRWAASSRTCETALAT